LVRGSAVAARGGGGRGRDGPRVFALRSLQGREGGCHGGRDVPGARAARARDLGHCVGSGTVAVGIRLGQLPRRGGPLSSVGAPHPAGRSLHPVGERCAGVAHRALAPCEHPAAGRRDGASLPDARHPRGRGQMTQIAVIGAGACGTTLADLLARKGAGVRLWAREPEVVASINREHVNHLFLPGAALAPEVRATGDVTEAVRAAEVVVSAAPSHAVSAVMSAAAMALRERPLVVSVSKGLEPERLSTLSCVLVEILPRGTEIAVLSGPSFAEEVYARQPTAVVAAAREHDVAQRVQQIFATTFFRVYSHTDVVGVELAGALKNVIALAAGMLE